MALQVIAHLPSCEDGNCPTIFRDSATGDVVVRGYVSAGSDEEADVRISAADWATLAAQLPR